MKKKAEVDVTDQARVTGEKEKTTELVQALTDEEIAEAIEERLRKKADKAKKKEVAPSAQPAADPTEYIYFAAFYASAPLEMLGDPTQLWHGGARGSKLEERS